MGLCIHHWVIGVSHKGIAHARCRKCGAECDFSNIPIYKSIRTPAKKKTDPPPVALAGNTSD